MRASDMHSGLDQQQREDTIREFKNKKIKILVATNILSRGIDIKEIGLVINYEVPHDAEDYVHRIGRTARADRTGEAITFINQKDVSNFLEIEKLIKKKVPRLTLPKSLGTTLEYNTVSRNKNKKHYFKKSPNKPNVPR
jgi:superfamily II DNA/RNA helicase